MSGLIPNDIEADFIGNDDMQDALQFTPSKDMKLAREMIKIINIEIEKKKVKIFVSQKGDNR